MPKKKGSLLYEIRKKLKIKPNELDVFMKAKTTTTKYNLEGSFEDNKLFRYLLFLKLNGGNLNSFFNEYIKMKDLKKMKK